MGFFIDVEGEGAVVAQNGVFKQVGLATRDGRLFLKVSGGYVGIMSDGSTTKNGLRLDGLTWDGSLYQDKLGRVFADKPADGGRVMADQRLLIKQ